MEGKLKDMPHCFRRTKIATILIMANFICSTIWRDDDCMVGPLEMYVLVDVLDTSEVGIKFHIQPSSKKHGEMRIIRNNMLIGECDVGLLTLGCVGEPMLWL